MGTQYIEMPWGKQANTYEVARNHTYALLKRHNVAFTGRESLEELYLLAEPFLDPV